MLIRDFEELAWVPGTTKIDKESNAELSHFADAATYPLAQMFPLQASVGVAGYV